MWQYVLVSIVVSLPISLLLIKNFSFNITRKDTTPQGPFILDLHGDSVILWWETPITQAGRIQVEAKFKALGYKNVEIMIGTMLPDGMWFARKERQ